MIGLDTNVLVRYLTHDDPAQTRIAVSLIDSLSQESPGFLPVVVVAELVWVLEFSYRFTKREIEPVLEGLLHSKELIIERAELVWKAVHLFASARADFSDCLIKCCADAAQCQYTVTFDRNAVTAGMQLLK